MRRRTLPRKRLMKICTRCFRGNIFTCGPHRTPRSVLRGESSRNVLHAAGGSRTIGGRHCESHGQRGGLAVPASGIIDLVIGLTFVFGVTAALASAVTELIS